MPLQDGLQPVDLAKQQGHQNCVRLLRELETKIRTPTRTQADTQGPEPEPGGEWDLRGWGCLASHLALCVCVSACPFSQPFLFHIRGLWSQPLAPLSSFQL